MRELWEQVQVYNVNVGDVIMINTYGHPATIDEGQIDKYGGIPSLDLHCEQTVFRRVPAADDPRVLRRALELAVEYMSGTDKDAQMEVVNEFIEDSRKELESEGTK